jgi:hypothetical protein
VDIVGTPVTISGKNGKISGYSESGGRYYRVWILLDEEKEEIVVKGQENIRQLLEKCSSHKKRG